MAWRGPGTDCYAESTDVFQVRMALIEMKIENVLIPKLFICVLCCSQRRKRLRLHFKSPVDYIHSFL